MPTTTEARRLLCEEDAHHGWGGGALYTPTQNLTSRKLKVQNPMNNNCRVFGGFYRKVAVKKT